MSKTRPYILSIAGFDPSGGAGILADVKTFEANKVYGMSVMTGNTFQNESEFEGVDWIASEKIIKQIEILNRKYKFEYAKIGLIENLEVLSVLVSHLRPARPAGGSHVSHLIWDPILKASAGYEIHKTIDHNKLTAILKQIYLLTPNTEEAIAMTGRNDSVEAAKDLSEYCNVYLKGGHDVNHKGKDLLFLKGGKHFVYNPNSKNVFAKHGSGCVLSSAIAANLANGYKLNKACLRGKQYTEKFLTSNKTLLGSHKI